MAATTPPDLKPRPDWMAPGVLYIVPTPIGNLGDITDRASEALASVDLIAAEDTRTARKLLSALRIRARAHIVSHHDHNAAASAEAIVASIKDKNLCAALVSDAGTPGCSDPGYRLVRRAIDEGVPVIPLPGPAAFLCALVASGLPTDRFHFIGFLPSSTSKRRQHLEALAALPDTLCFYASPRRIIDLLEDARDTLGDRRACLGRELTKRHEELIRGSFTDLIDDLRARDAIRGELSLVVEGHQKIESAPDRDEALRMIKAMRGQGVHPKAIKKVVAELLGINAREVYEMMTHL